MKNSFFTTPMKILITARNTLAPYSSDIPQKYLNKDYKNTGISFGKTTSLGETYNVAFNCETHLLVIGGSGSGKSSNIVIPTIRSWGGPIFAIDIKSEISNFYERTENDRPFIKFDPTNYNCFKYDPFKILIDAVDADEIEIMREIAYSIIPDVANNQYQFWVDNERNLLIGALLYYYGIGADFSMAIIGIQTTDIFKLLEEIEKSKNEEAIMFIKDMKTLKPETLSDIGTGLSSQIIIFATDPHISRVFGKDDEDEKFFDWSDIETHNIFFSIPEYKIEEWSSVIRLMTNQLFRYLHRRPDKHSDKGKDQQQILLLLDEFASIGHLNIIRPLSLIRSKSVTIALFIQSIAQLDSIYGDSQRKIIVDNCGYKVFLNAQDVETQAYMSDAVGTYLDYNTYLPIIRPADFRTLDKMIVLTPKDRFAVATYPYYEKHKEEEN